MPSQILVFDGVDLSDYIQTWQEIAPTRLNIVTVPRRHGGLISDAVVQDVRQINLTGRVVSPDNTALGLRTTLLTLSELLNRQNKKLQLWDDMYIVAYKSSFGYQYVDGSSLRAADITINFQCVDPFWYSTTPSTAGSTDPIISPNLTTSDQLIDFTNNIYRRDFTIVNTGNLFVFPVITVQAGATPLTHITVRNLTLGRLFTYTGTVQPGKILTVDTANFEVTNDGVEDLTNWAGDFVWLNPGSNSIEIEGTTPAAYGWTWTSRNN